MKTVEVLRVERGTAACQHGQDDGTDRYYGLRIHVLLDGQPRVFFFRTSEAMYPGNDVMVAMLNALKLEGLK
jgi:hypothetical protein